MLRSANIRYPAEEQYTGIGPRCPTNSANATLRYKAKCRPTGRIIYLSGGINACPAVLPYAKSRKVLPATAGWPQVAAMIKFRPFRSRRQRLSNRDIRSKAKTAMIGITIRFHRTIFRHDRIISFFCREKTEEIGHLPAAGLFLPLSLAHCGRQAQKRIYGI
jgi:hypothetical protein